MSDADPRAARADLRPFVIWVVALELLCLLLFLAMHRWGQTRVRPAFS